MKGKERAYSHGGTCRLFLFQLVHCTLFFIRMLSRSRDRVRGSIGLGIRIGGSIGLGIGIGLGVVVSVLPFLRNTPPPKKSGKIT